jgi:hypothetical protein
MATSFNINKADLAFILRQIKIAELHAGTNGTPMTLLDAIAQEYGISATNAALTPFGLRTVDGSENNLLAGQVDLGAADTTFPRLTNSTFLNEQDEAAFRGITNTNYNLSVTGNNLILPPPGAPPGTPTLLM